MSKATTETYTQSPHLVLYSNLDNCKSIYTVLIFTCQQRKVNYIIIIPHESDHFQMAKSGWSGQWSLLFHWCEISGVFSSQFQSMLCMAADVVVELGTDGGVQQGVAVEVETHTENYQDRDKQQQ